MADIIITKSNSRRGRNTTKVDLTAMVDLGFLLITFFMLATTMTKPHTMEINKPDDTGEESKIKVSKTLNLMLGDNNKLYWYVAPDDEQGETDILLDSTNYSSSGLRKILINRKAEVIKKHGLKSADDLFVMIKPLSGSTLKNTVDVLDEMSISNIKRYAILKADNEVDKLVAKKVNQIIE